MKSLAPTWPALVARLYLGTIFLVAASSKLMQRDDFAGPMSGFLDNVAIVRSFGWYANFIRSVVEPNVHVFSILIITAEAAIAVSMLFGLATRLAAVVAIFLLTNYAFAKGMPPWSPGSNDFADIVLCIVVLVGAAGRNFGIDKSLHEKFPRVPFW